MNLSPFSYFFPQAALPVLMAANANWSGTITRNIKRFLIARRELWVFIVCVRDNYEEHKEIPYCKTWVMSVYCVCQRQLRGTQRDSVLQDVSYECLLCVSETITRNIKRFLIARRESFFVYSFFCVVLTVGLWWFCILCLVDLCEYGFYFCFEIGSKVEN